MTFLYNLQDLIDRNQINRSKLAKSIGIAPSTINAWFTKDFNGITLKNLNKLATYFDVSIETLVHGQRNALTFTNDNYTDAELQLIYEYSQFIKHKRI